MGFRVGDNAPMAFVELVDRPEPVADRGQGRRVTTSATATPRAGLRWPFAWWTRWAGNIGYHAGAEDALCLSSKVEPLTATKVTGATSIAESMRSRRFLTSVLAAVRGRVPARGCTAEGRGRLPRPRQGLQALGAALDERTVEVVFDDRARLLPVPRAVQVRGARRRDARRGADRRRARSSSTRPSRRTSRPIEASVRITLPVQQARRRVQAAWSPTRAAPTAACATRRSSASVAVSLAGFGGDGSVRVRRGHRRPRPGGRCAPAAAVSDAAASASGDSRDRRRAAQRPVLARHRRVLRRRRCCCRSRPACCRWCRSCRRSSSGRAPQCRALRGLALAASYSLGMALVYTAFGVAAGLAGEGLAAALQTPWVLGAFASACSCCRVSMFGFYELQLPDALHGHVHRASHKTARRPRARRVRDGRHVGADRQPLRGRAAGRRAGLHQPDARRDARRHGAVLAGHRHERAAAAGRRVGRRAAAARRRVDGGRQAVLRRAAARRGDLDRAAGAARAARRLRCGARCSSAARSRSSSSAAPASGPRVAPASPRRSRGSSACCSSSAPPRAAAIRCSRWRTCAPVPRATAADLQPRFIAVRSVAELDRALQHRGPPGDARLLRRLVRVVQGDGALHLRRPGRAGAAGRRAAAQGRRHRQQRPTTARCSSASSCSARRARSSSTPRAARSPARA